MGNGIEDISTERTRQISDEGWGDRHDDHHKNNELVRAAICYAMLGMHTQVLIEMQYIAKRWPFDESWLKIDTGTGGMRRSLVKAGALIAAEIDRLDRAAELDEGRPVPPHGSGP